jgi:hypothetical protein
VKMPAPPGGGGSSEGGTPPAARSSWVLKPVLGWSCVWLGWKAARYRLIWLR